MAFEAVIGLEVHVQLNTKSKAFCSDLNSFGVQENKHISAISLAQPGTLPRPNIEHLKSAIKLGLAIGSDITTTTFFDRKNYFYADLPKGYQITQDGAPICRGGSFQIETSKGQKVIRIHQIHMEEDAGKSIHDKDPSATLIDLNRAGTPLLEIVSEPDLRSAEEAAEFIRTVRQMVRYLDISDGDMEKGSLRCDCNISIRKKGETHLNTRCEVKNVNSINYAKRAIEYEISRQIDCFNTGEEIIQCTLDFNPQTGKTTPMRAKENAHDYRYLPDPDLPIIHVRPSFLEDIKETIDATPKQLFNTCVQKYNISTTNAIIITAEKEFALHFLAAAKQIPYTDELVKLYINKLLPIFNKVDKKHISIKRLSSFLELIDKNNINKSTAYQVLLPFLLKDSKSVNELAETLDIIQDNDSTEGYEIVTTIIAKHPEELTRYKGGHKNLFGFFMGEVMKASKGKLDPQKAKDILSKALK